MLPYLSTNPVNLFRSVLKLIIKDEFLKNCRSSSQLTKVDFEIANIIKKNRDIAIGFSTESVLSNMEKKDIER